MRWRLYHSRNGTGYFYVFQSISKSQSAIIEYYLKSLDLNKFVAFDNPADGCLHFFHMEPTAESKRRQKKEKLNVILIAQ